MARGVKQGLAKFFRRNGAKLEMAELSGSVLHLRDGNFDDDALPQRGDLRRIERQGTRPGMMAAIVAAVVADDELGERAERLLVGRIAARAEGEERKSVG